MTDDPRTQRHNLFRRNFGLLRCISVMALHLLIVILSAGCTVDKTTPQQIETSAPTEMPDGAILPVPTATETLPPVEAIPITPTLIPTLKVVEAVYLAFENGFMVYVDGESCLYAYADGAVIPGGLVGVQPGYYVYCLPFDELPAATTNAPEEPFGRIWSYYEEVPDALGAQIGEAIRYTTTIPPDEPVIMGGVFYSGMITLPDGLMLYCGTRAATGRRCELRSP